MLAYRCVFVFVCLIDVIGCRVNDVLNDVVWLLWFVLLCVLCSCEFECVCVFFGELLCDVA